MRQHAHTQSYLYTHTNTIIETTIIETHITHPHTHPHTHTIAYTHSYTAARVPTLARLARALSVFHTQTPEHPNLRQNTLTQSYVWHDSFVCMPWLIRVYDMTRHGSFVFMTWLVCTLASAWELQQTECESIVKGFVARLTSAWDNPIRKKINLLPLYRPLPFSVSVSLFLSLSLFLLLPLYWPPPFSLSVSLSLSLSLSFPP